MHLKALATATAALIALLDHATCPTPADLASGIGTKLDDGQTEVHTSAAKDIVQVDVRYNDGTNDGSVMQFGHGLYLRNVIPVEDGVLRIGQQEKYASDATLRKWAKPEPNAAWSNTRPDGGTSQSGPMQTVQIGKCAYDGFKITISFADDPNYVEVYTYLPTLGIGLLTTIIENGDTDAYRYVSIAAK